MDNEQIEQKSDAVPGNGADESRPRHGEVVGEMWERTEAQRPRAADTAQHAADAAREAARKLKGEEAWMAGLVEQGADRLSDFAQTLRNNDLRSLLSSVEEFARRQPVLFTMGAAALGFALTRTVGLAAQGGSRAAEHTAEPENDVGRESRYEH